MILAAELNWPEAIVVIVLILAFTAYAIVEKMIDGPSDDD